MESQNLVDDLSPKKNTVLKVCLRTPVSPVSCLVTSENTLSDTVPTSVRLWLLQLSNGPVVGSRKRPSEGNYEKEKEHCIALFDQWSEADQVEFVERLISRMCHYQHGHINSYLKPMLQRDFITALPGMHATFTWKQQHYLKTRLCIFIFHTVVI